jgi:hypothetical protein
MKSSQEFNQMSDYFGSEYDKFNPLYKKYFKQGSLAICCFNNYMIDESDNLFEWGSVDYMLEINKLIDFYQNKFNEYYLLAQNILNVIDSNNTLSDQDVSIIFDYTFIVW